jgi:hypothetical protein
VTWQAYHEPLRVTVARTGFVGLLVGLIAAGVPSQHAFWPQWTAFALWFSLGGHWVELAFLNWLRPRLAAARGAQVAGRLLVWLVGGTVLLVGARIMAASLSARPLRLPPWWLGGPGFVGLELVIHALSQLRAIPNFYNGLR